MKTKNSYLNIGVVLTALAVIFTPLIIVGQMDKEGPGSKTALTVQKNLEVLPGAQSKVVEFYSTTADGATLITKGRGVISQIRVNGITTNGNVPTAVAVAVRFLDVATTNAAVDGTTNKYIIPHVIITSNSTYTIDYPHGVQFENGCVIRTLTAVTNSSIGVNFLK